MDGYFYYDDDDDYDVEEFDAYGEPMYWDTEEEEELPPSISFHELKENCIWPSLLSISPSLSRLMLYCLLMRFTNCLVELPPVVIHLTSILTGILALNDFFGKNMAYVIILCFLSYISLFIIQKTVKKFHGPFCTVAIICFLLMCELFLVDAKDWHSIRGVQMIIAMKAISLGFDLDNGSILLFPLPLQFGGYCLCVGTVIFGPWISYNNYLKLLQKANVNVAWAVKILMSSILALVFLLVSTCFSSWLLSGWSNKWLFAYRDALSFRTSHYFVSFISEATAVFAGLGAINSKWDVAVSHPSSIELPRSLTEVVVNWNIPMHYWLKTYVFKSLKPSGAFKAIIGTYVASSLLHGLSFPLAAVLLSLGFYTYIEFVFREKLSDVFNACILVRPCKNGCSHIYKKTHPAVIATNVGFGFLSVFHLAYLGLMFDSASNLQEQGYSAYHTLSKWSNLNYASHFVAAGTYIVHLLI